MSVGTIDLPQDIDPKFVLMMQNRELFQGAVELVDNANFLFSLSTMMLKRRLSELGSPATEAEFLLGAKAYQVVSGFAFPAQETFVVPPITTIAYDVAGEIGSQSGQVLLDLGVEQAEYMPAVAPLLADTMEEILDRYTQSKGSLRIAMGGTALMHTAHIRAQEALVA